MNDDLEAVAVILREHSIDCTWRGPTMQWLGMVIWTSCVASWLTAAAAHKQARTRQLSLVSWGAVRDLQPPGLDCTSRGANLDSWVQARGGDERLLSRRHPLQCAAICPHYSGAALLLDLSAKQQGAKWLLLLSSWYCTIFLRQIKPILPVDVAAHPSSSSSPSPSASSAVQRMP